MGSNGERRTGSAYAHWDRGAGSPAREQERAFHHQDKVPGIDALSPTGPVVLLAPPAAPG